ncbi:MAG: dihydrofolate reductase family protein [Sutterella sp.]
MSEALDSLEALFDVHTLLLEGGGILNGSFLEADLIDEVSLLVYPGIDGVYGSPAIFGRQCGDEPSPSRHVRLKLIEAEPLPGGVVWLHYENCRSA